MGYQNSKMNFSPLVSVLTETVAPFARSNFPTINTNAFLLGILLSLNLISLIILLLG